MATKSRYQNPVIGDDVLLQLFVKNSNNSASLDSINEVKIYYLDPTQRSDGNPDGRTLVETITGSTVTNPDQGEYLLTLNLDSGTYTNNGYYIDVWHVNFAPGDPETTLEHVFQIFPDLWYTTPIPIVYDFDFYFQPNKMRYGTNKPIEIEIRPNVPRATDLQQYYENLAIAANVYVTISQRCGECVPCEEDLRIVKEDDPVMYKEKNRAYYRIDTTEFECGVYDIWFRMEFGENVYVSDTYQFQIYK